jgi:hypothetical protein
VLAVALTVPSPVLEAVVVVVVEEEVVVVVVVVEIFSVAFSEQKKPVSWNAHFEMSSGWRGRVRVRESDARV